jgi:hypothetical protein
VHKTCIGIPSMADITIEGWPILTGELARRLQVPEARIADAIRRGRIEAPPVRGGRRLWWPRHARAAAEYLGRSLNGNAVGTGSAPTSGSPATTAVDGHEAASRP